jgi:dimethylaniline monooxygenase (N-oxide forming)
MGQDQRRVAVVGAGAGGICAAKHLLEAGVDVTIFEIGSHVGGLWVYDNDNGRSVAYGSLRINSEARVTSYPDFPFPPGTPLYPAHREVTAYLESYARRFGVYERIRFRAPVTSVAPGPEGWTVTTPAGAEDFDAVVIASGHQAAPAHPPYAADFTGEYRHSFSYREPAPFAGQRVLVVGVGNSGLDIAADVCTVASRCLVAVRSPVLIMPRMLCGVPTSRLLARLNKPWMPWLVQRTWMRTLSWIAHGSMEQWGLRAPRTRTHPAGHPTFMAHVAYGRIEIRPGIRSISDRTVTFEDGRTDEVDVLIAATGYEIDLPFLEPDISPAVGRRVEVYKRVIHPDHPGLFFVGFFNASGGANIRMMDVQARWVAAIASGRAGVPDRAEMRRDIEAEKRFIADRYPAAERYGLELDPIHYPRDVANEIQRPTEPRADRSGAPLPDPV